MKKKTAFIMTMEEYDKFLRTTSGNVWGIANENGECFYILTEDADEDDDSDEAVCKMLSKELNETVTEVIIDITKQKVVIVCE